MTDGDVDPQRRADVDSRADSEVQAVTHGDSEPTTAPTRPPADSTETSTAGATELDLGAARMIASLLTPEGERLDPARHAHLLCDPVFHPLLVDGRHTPLALGRSVRLANRAQRRALNARDGGCVFPGCDRPPGWCDAHHIQPFEQGGVTDLPNLALLCRHHHGVIHRVGWSLSVQPDGIPIWTTPAGHTLVGPRRSQLVLAA